MTHQIQHQIIELDWYGSETNAMRFQQRLSDWATYALTPALAMALDSCESADSQLHIEKLVVEVGEISIEDFESQMARRVAEAMTLALQEKLRQWSALSDGDVKAMSLAQHTAEAWGYFLQTGLLPWGYSLPAGTSWELVICDLLQTNPTAMMAILRPLLPKPVVQERLVKQFSEKFLEILLNHIDSSLASATKPLLNAIKVLQEESLTPYKNQAVKQLWSMIWQTVATQKVWNNADVWESLLQTLPPALAQAHPEWKTLVFKKNEPTQRHKTKKQADAPSLLPLSASKLEVGTAEIPNELYVQQAGLVLLHPFLPRFMEAVLGAVDEVLVDKEKAVLALHFLATGKLEASEYELTMEKIICNMALNTPLPKATHWTNHDTDESEALLGAVLGYWPAMQESSVGLLRAEFLQRNGKLTRRNDDWLLQVERRDFDFLLEQIPWGFGTLKLPWMRGFLHVEWI